MSTAQNMSAAAPILDLSQWPIALIRYPKNCTDAQVQAANMQIIGLLKRQQPFCLISDTTQTAPSPSQGKMQQKMMEDYRDAFRQYLVGSCLVASNPLWRAGMRAILHLSKPPFRCEVKDSLIAAHLWCEEMMRQHTAVLP